VDAEPTAGTHQFQSFDCADLIRIALVALLATATWFRLWEPLPRLTDVSCCCGSFMQLALGVVGGAMNYARLATAAVVSTVAYYVYGFLVEGLLIRKDFAPYTAVYRPAEAVPRYMPLGLVCTLIATFVIALIYAKGYEGGSGAAEGARFGLLVALFVVCIFVVPNYVTLNIGGKLAAELALSTFFQWLLVCIVIGLIYKPAITEMH